MAPGAHAGGSRRFNPVLDLRICVSEIADGAVRLIVHGAVDLGTAPQLRAALSAAVRDHAGPLIVDLADLSFGGADCLNALLQASDALHQKGRRLHVVNAPGCFRRVLAACQLDELTS